MCASWLHHRPLPRHLQLPPIPAPAASGASAGTEEDFEFNLEEEASGPEFEIDADATSYYMPVPNTVSFKAKALNGSPPITFTWNFGDGTPEATGETPKHTYTKLGRFDAIVTGKDASGAISRVTLAVMVVEPETFVNRLQLDPKLLQNWRTPAPDATP